MIVLSKSLNFRGERIAPSLALQNRLSGLAGYSNLEFGNWLGGVNLQHFGLGGNGVSDENRSDEFEVLAHENGA